MVKTKRSKDKNPKIFGIILFAIILIAIGINCVSADTLYWVGIHNGSLSNASSWASTSGGAGGGM